jgi:hypothetical protein
MGLSRAEERRAQIEQKKARTKLWRKGNLAWKFAERPWCREMYDWVRKAWGIAGFLFVMMHRRGGKSTTALAIGLEECLRAPNITVAIVTNTREQAEGICTEAMTELLKDCPKDLAPRLIKNKYTYVFDHNNSKLVMLPADKTNFQKLRGRKFRLIIFTEACFIDGIGEIIKKTLPTLRDVLGQTSGMMLLESTPPDEPGHDTELLFAEAELDGRAWTLPLSRNTRASALFVEQAKKDSGGEDSITYRREYELEFVFEDETTVLPEFTKARAEEGDLDKGLPRIVREVARPPGADLYSALDIGGTDLSALVYGFFHFTEDLLVIEDEDAMVNFTSDVLARKVRAKEEKLWGVEPKGKLRRYADNNNLILLFDLYKLYKLKFQASGKDNKDAVVNLLRVMIKEGRIAIHPRCKLLIKTMRTAKHASQKRKGFRRTKELGHADLLEALLFVVRNVRHREMPKDTSPAQPQATQGTTYGSSMTKREERALADDGFARALGLARRWGR